MLYLQGMKGNAKNRRTVGDGLLSWQLNQTQLGTGLEVGELWLLKSVLIVLRRSRKKLSSVNTANEI